MKSISAVGVKDIIDSLSEGVYVCDLDRTITYWSRSAQRITGWEEADVVGRQCFDSVLCHIDKDGHQLCGEEYCPLHRAMITGTGTTGSLLVYAQGKNGDRIPTLVSVAPIRDDSGRVVGGVETFRDASEVVHDLEKAKSIQTLALQHELPEDDRVAFNTHYIPHEIVGGDYFAIEPLDDDRYGLMLADVMGHGIAAALYTMHLSQLWERFHREVVNPSEFTARVNNELVAVIKSDQSFATAVCGVLDLKNRTFRCAAAGGPPVLLTHPDGSYGLLKNPGLPLGIMTDADYEEVEETVRGGDSLLFYSDGAVEIRDAAGGMLGIDGLIAILHSLGYPRSPIRMDALEEALLKFSNAIRLEDDLTFIEIRLGDV
ncbi:MAG: SpoIIE family protein phosphatase [Phycisphaerales bacterium]|nr:MAG: SpoIIE family protein phosphatase [Phycisphaerales bacterium]